MTRGEQQRAKDLAKRDANIAAALPVYTVKQWRAIELGFNKDRRTKVAKLADRRRKRANQAEARKKRLLRPRRPSNKAA